MIVVNKILFPTDFSECSLAAIEHVSSLAILYNAQIHLLNVLENDPVLAFHAVDLHSETALRDPESRIREQMNVLIADNFKFYRNLTTAVRRGDASREIVRYADEEGIDLIIMATHGRSGLAHVVMGSVAERVVRRSFVPVLTIKPAAMRPKYMEQQDIDEQLHMKSN